MNNNSCIFNAQMSTVTAQPLDQINKNPRDRILDLPFFFHYKLITSLKNHPSPSPGESLPYRFQGNFAAIFVLNYWSRENFFCLKSLIALN